MNSTCDDIQQRLVARLQTRWIGHPLRVLNLADSTNDIAKEAGEAGASEGLVVVALEQRRGRGRRGRNWVSMGGQGVYLSVLLRPEMPPSDMSWFAMLGGVATLEAVQALGVKELLLKWPNDVLARGRKIAGVLIEPRTGGERIEFVALGIGVNVHQSSESFATEALNATATSCLMEGVSTSLEEVALSLMDRIEYWYERMKTGERKRLLETWIAHGGTDRMPVIE